ncbi:anti-sigma factor family protein [Streptomyces pacificus]|uniref:Putative zinc-finger domain-containing protein n=1 Tax=Streptomyces pacificus TaxID=2705029 RepID=A0A6A0ALP8_9ACTN|nr:zf-HC2 domain-containing protein [Streptomyces pacificus]GFH33859.1 hypothetical protein SCWH03_00590 [Streptomyces pacificus]
MNRQDQSGQFGQSEEGSVHETAGAYVLGILDEAEATAFEAHLAGCDICAAHLEEFAGMEPMLAMLADAPVRPGVPRQPAALPFDSKIMQPPERAAAVVPTAPSPQLLDRLVDEVAVKRSRKRRRSLYMIAASVVLILGGPAVAVVVTQDDATAGSTGAPRTTSAAEDVFFDDLAEKIEATNAATGVSATVGLEEKGWGIHAVLELKNVKGPLKCSLVAVPKSGEEEVMTSWSVPERGYGIADSTDEEARKPLYIHGGAAMERNEIDHFEVRTLDGQVLVEVDG